MAKRKERTLLRGAIIGQFKTIRNFCFKHNYDEGFMSAVLNGYKPVPKDMVETFEKYLNDFEGGMI